MNPLNTTVDFNITVYRNSDFSDPLVLVPFIWMLLCLILNFGVVLHALAGLLINPRITKLVVGACSLTVCWMIMYITQSFIVTNRAISVLATWLGLALTLSTTIEHLELLKLFVCLSAFWTIQKCVTYQRILVVLHVVITAGCYVWPVGLETNPIASKVLLLTRFIPLLV